MLRVHVIEVKFAHDSKWQSRRVPERVMSLEEAGQKCRELNRQGKQLGLEYRVRPRF